MSSSIFVISQNCIWSIFTSKTYHINETDWNNHQSKLYKFFYNQENKCICIWIYSFSFITFSVGGGGVTLKWMRFSWDFMHVFVNWKLMNLYFTLYFVSSKLSTFCQQVKYNRLWLGWDGANRIILALFNPQESAMLFGGGSETGASFMKACRGFLPSLCGMLYVCTLSFMEQSLHQVFLHLIPVELLRSTASTKSLWFWTNHTHHHD